MLCREKFPDSLLELGKRLVEFYAPTKWPQLQARYKETVNKRAEELNNGPLIRAPWRDMVPLL